MIAHLQAEDKPEELDDFLAMHAGTEWLIYEHVGNEYQHWQYSKEEIIEHLIEVMENSLQYFGTLDDLMRGSATGRVLIDRHKQAVAKSDMLQDYKYAALPYF